MTYRSLVLISAFAAGVGVVAPPTLTANAQTKAPTRRASSWTPPRTPWGDPDLQGMWTNTTTTPLERPKDLEGKQVLEGEELAVRDKEVAEQLNFDRRGKPGSGDVGLYNEKIWLERGKLGGQTSLVVDPPDGKLPPLTPEGEKKQAARAAYTKAHPADSWEDISTFTRCITRGLPNGMMPGFYNHNYHILQTPGYVVVLVEMIHEARIIPLDRPHMNQNIRQWMGDSRGHWDGNTLVVETTNFTNKVNYRGSDERMRLVERFTRLDADTIDYRFTVDDATTFTRPWTASIPMTKLQGLLYEYACHEANYSMPGILGGARVQEKAAEEAAKKQAR